ncbi:ShKT domain-containing protein [Caenorhabditis elegans]|uniref:ShKT domain-containing protein n=1 Tax=Caenorhabditis elegans TaxID=6239 RepID=Q9XV17_CAEEL|nr:ShKT domain-containing protein [Caenorhabditis elegans]CAB04402.1 ShKT domain-containing protein [Caenorhabditis elegans]|eukprot:NP_507973.1 Uncharacterized protein CELE_F46B3.1 [Caenorhabditis elegans]
MRLLIITILAGVSVLASCDQCVDYDITCYQRLDQCGDSFTKAQCPYTCGLCKKDPNECSDTNDECQLDMSPCETDQYQKICPKTCNVCPPAICVDQWDNCPLYKLINQCTRYHKTKCPLSCGLCTGNVTTPATTTSTTTPIPLTTTIECKDSLLRCSEMAKQGFCFSPAYKPEDKKRLCGKTCRLC